MYVFIVVQMKSVRLLLWGWPKWYPSVDVSRNAQSARPCDFRFPKSRCILNHSELIHTMWNAVFVLAIVTDTLGTSHSKQSEVLMEIQEHYMRQKKLEFLLL